MGVPFYLLRWACQLTTKTQRRCDPVRTDSAQTGIRYGKFSGAKLERSMAFKKDA